LVYGDHLADSAPLVIEGVLSRHSDGACDALLVTGRGRSALALVPR
jgi:hypothetical protein